MQRDLKNVLLTFGAVMVMLTTGAYVYHDSLVKEEEVVSLREVSQRENEVGFEMTEPTQVSDVTIETSSAVVFEVPVEKPSRTTSAS